MEPIIAILLYAGSYIAAFFVVKSLIFNNAIMGKIAQSVGNIGRNFSANQAKKRAGIRAENMAKMKSGSRFAGNNVLSRGFNSASVRAGTGVRGRFGFGERGAQAIDQATRIGSDEIAKTASFNALKDDDNALRAMTYRSAGEAYEGVKQHLINNKMAPELADAEAKRAVNAVQAGPRFGKSQQIASIQAMTNTGTAFTDASDVASSVARAAGGKGGNAQTAATLAGYVNAVAKQKGRHDWAPGAGKLIQAAHADMNLSDASGTPIAPISQEKLDEAGWDSGSLYQLSNGKSAATERLTAHWVKQYRQALASGDNDKLLRATTAMQEMRAMLPNATGDNQKHLNDALANMSAQRENYMKSNSFVAPGSMGPTGPRQAAFEQAENLARQRARTYERPDINNVGP